MKKLLAQEEAMIPALFFNLKRALIPLLDDSTYVTMQEVAAAAESRGRNGKDRLPSKKQEQQRNNEVSTVRVCRLESAGGKYCTCVQSSGCKQGGFECWGEKQKLLVQSTVYVLCMYCTYCV